MTRSHRRNYPDPARSLRAAAITMLLVPTLATAQANAIDTAVDQGGGSAPPASLDVRRAQGAIRVDGRLDDEGWKDARVVDRFREFQPGNMTEPPVRTEGMLAFDDEYLYVGIHAYDDPKHVRASLRERDDMFQDDWAGIGIDTYGDASWGYLLIANAYGVQGDTRLGNDGDDAGFDIVFESAGRRTDDGYVVELAIPFSSLRFPEGGASDWRMVFVRNYPRSSRFMFSWPALDNDNPCLLCQFAPITGMADVQPTAGLELLPSVVASEAGELRDGDPALGFHEGSVDAGFSLGARYPFADGWSAEATFNPDFSQVESDAAQVDVNTTFALSFPERRPFFQEGADLFETSVNQVYTRSINDPLVAGRVTGVVGSTSIAWVGAYDERSPVILPFEESSAFVEAGGSVSNIVRVRHDAGDGSSYGMLATDRRYDLGGSGSTVGFDGLYRFGKVYSIEAQLVASRTAEPDSSALTGDVNGDTFDDGAHTAAFDGETYWGRAAHLRLARSARGWSWNARYDEASPTFRAANGFVASNSYRRVNGWTGYDFYPNRYGVSQIQPSVSVGRLYNFDGVRKDEWIEPSLYVALPGQTNVNLGWLGSSERFRGVEFGPYHRWWANVNTRFSETVSFGFYADRGSRIARREDPPLLGEGTTLSGWATIKPIDRLSIEPGIDWQKLDRPDGSNIYAGYIARTKVQLQFNRELSLRLVTQYDDFSDAVSFEPLLVYRLNPFTIFYVGSTDRYQQFDRPYGFERTQRQFFMKFQYLLRS